MPMHFGFQSIESRAFPYHSKMSLSFIGSNSSTFQVVAAMCSKVLFLSNAIMKAAQCDSFNLLVNNGSAAGQVIFHTHFHIIPRKAGDQLWPSESFRRRPLEQSQETIGLVNSIKEHLCASPCSEYETEGSAAPKDLVIGKIFEVVNTCIKDAKLLSDLNMRALPALYDQFVKLIKYLLDNRKEDRGQVVILFQGMLEVVTRDIMDLMCILKGSHHLLLLAQLQ